MRTFRRELFTSSPSYLYCIDFYRQDSSETILFNTSSPTILTPAVIIRNGRIGLASLRIRTVGRGLQVARNKSLTVRTHFVILYLLVTGLIFLFSYTCFPHRH
jgi:hypothetical protein